MCGKNSHIGKITNFWLHVYVRSGLSDQPGLVIIIEMEEDAEIVIDSSVVPSEARYGDNNIEEDDQYDDAIFIRVNIYDAMGVITILPIDANTRTESICQSLYQKIDVHTKVWTISYLPLL